MTSDVNPLILSGYEALAGGAGLVDFSDRTLVELSGDDRARFLHNFCTNDILKLPAQSSCEAFLTNAQGKILAYALVFAEPQSLILETVAGQGPSIVKHLDRYLVREKVKLNDRTSEWAEWFLAGPQAPAVLEKVCPGAVPPQQWESTAAVIAGQNVSVRVVDILGPTGFLIAGPRSAAGTIGEALIDAGATSVVAAAFEAARIEAGFPLYGVDITERNLPQEVARDDRTISFKKGCYLGQETVARIDALGHVNWLLSGLRLSGQDVPPPGLELYAVQATAGHVTSAAYSPRSRSYVALAYLRRGHHTPGTKLDYSGGTAEVVSLPMVGHAGSPA
jgi:tRNA-modifying protein YgfZ